MLRDLLAIARTTHDITKIETTKYAIQTQKEREKNKISRQKKRLQIIGITTTSMITSVSVIRGGEAAVAAYLVEVHAKFF